MFRQNPDKHFFLNSWSDLFRKQNSDPQPCLYVCRQSIGKNFRRDVIPDSAPVLVHLDYRATFIPGFRLTGVTDLISANLVPGYIKFGSKYVSSYYSTLDVWVSFQLLTQTLQPIWGGGSRGVLYAPPPVVFCSILLLKILDFSQLFVVDAPMKKLE